MQVYTEDKEFERFVRERDLEKLEDERKELVLYMNKAKTDDTKDKRRHNVIEKKFQIEKLEDEFMDEDKFWGYAGEDNEFDYGRMVLSDDVLDAFLKLPYIKLELKTDPELVFTDLANLDPRSKRRKDPHIRFVKLAIQVEAKTSINKDKPANEKEALAPPKKGPENSYIEKDIEDICNKYTFNLFETHFLKRMAPESSFVCRLYILRCQNLAATSSNADIKDRLAGYSAKCTANPYLRITIGDENSGDASGMKVIDEKDKAQANTLNPEFYQSYEFDVSFPRDWKLKIDVCDSSFFSLGIFSDTVIGSTVIDLEDRYYGDPYRTLEFSLKYYEKEASKAKERTSGGSKKLKADPRYQKKKKAAEDKYKEVSKAIDDFKKVSDHKVPVEFRELIDPSKNQSQGIIEMWVEVYAAEEAK